MVEFARAIVDDPKLLLLDEPTSGLDEREAERLVEQLQLLRSSTTCAVILVEHDMGFVMEQCDTIAVLELGQVLAIGAPKAIQEDPLVRAAYLGEGSGHSKHRNIEHSRGTVVKRKRVWIWVAVMAIVGLVAATAGSAGARVPSQRPKG